MLKKVPVTLLILVSSLCVLQKIYAETPSDIPEKGLFSCNVPTAENSNCMDMDEEEFRDIEGFCEYLPEVYESLPEVLDYIKTVDSALYRIITTDGNINDDYEEDMLEFAEFKLMQQQYDDPELKIELKHMVLEFHFDILAGKYHETDNKTQRKNYQKEMKELLSRLFDIKVAIRRLRIKILQEELNELKAEVDNIKADKAGQIDTFLSKVTTSLTIFEQ